MWTTPAAVKAKRATKVAKSAKIASKAKPASKAIKSACFVEGTLVLSEYGNVPIEKIKIGDYVYSENPETGENGLRKVVQTFVRESNELIHINVDNQKITTTPEHPFYVPQSGWTKAINLRAGDILVLQNGSYVTIEKVQHEILEKPVTVYNFEVEGLHTYFVSKSAVLVHNSCKKDIKQITDVAKKFKVNRWDFGDYVENYKISKGLRNGATLSWKVLEKLAKEFKRK